MPRTKRHIPKPKREPGLGHELTLTGHYCEPRPGEVKGMIWGLRKCPCCGADPDVVYSSVTGDVTIACSKRGCRIVQAPTDTEATKIWNEIRFTDKKP